LKQGKEELALKQTYPNIPIYFNIILSKKFK